MATKTLHTAAPAPSTDAFRNWFSSSKVVDAQGQPLQVYRGDFRGDRVSDSFKVNRTTSGRFFFTDDPQVASNYAIGKMDVAHTEENQECYQWFKFPKYRYPRERTAPDLKQVWYRLNATQQQRVRDVALTTTLDDGELTFDVEGPINSRQNMEWDVKQERGNWLMAMAGAWLSSGAIFGEERTFGKILHRMGLEFEYDDPSEPRSTVTAVFLRITHPLDTSHIPAHVVDHFRQMAGKDRTRAKSVGADHWDKSTITLKEWFSNLEADTINRTTYAWTSVPEKVTQALQQMGYDGIKDTGGKMGGVGHVVWIAFEPSQIKSSIGNKGTYHPGKHSIVASAKRSANSSIRVVDQPRRATAYAILTSARSVTSGVESSSQAPKWLADHHRKHKVDPSITKGAWASIQTNRSQLAADNMRVAKERHFGVTPDDRLVLYHGTRSGDAIRKAGYLHPGSFLSAIEADARGYAFAAQNRGKAEVLRLEVYPGYGSLSGDGYFVSREPIPVKVAKAATPRFLRQVA